MRYTLGTDQTAALRLERLASFFNPGGLCKIWFPDGRKETVLSSCAALKGCDKLSMSWDENWYTFFSRPTNTSSIVLIENLFIQ